MKSYTGTKTVLARPMTSHEYTAYRNEVKAAPLYAIAPGDDQDGYLVEYTDGLGNRNDSRHAGYVSWSPANVFERSYKEDVPGLKQHVPFQGNVLNSIVVPGTVSDPPKLLVHTDQGLFLFDNSGGQPTLRPVYIQST
jgi:hypothetical protein